MVVLPQLRSSLKARSWVQPSAAELWKSDRLARRRYDWNAARTEPYYFDEREAVVLDPFAFCPVGVRKWQSGERDFIADVGRKLEPFRILIVPVRWLIIGYWSTTWHCHIVSLVNKRS